jgi:hypothetical protein
MWRSLPNINFNAFFRQKQEQNSAHFVFFLSVPDHGRIFLYGLMQAWPAGMMHLKPHKGHLKGNRSSALL